MRGLAFPTNAPFDRELSYEHGTPSSNVDDIPIDPALAEPAIDPSLVGSGTELAQIPPQPLLGPSTPVEPPQDPYSQVRQYSQGPQGDPFAPQPLPFFPIQPALEPPSPRKPPKRKRKPPPKEKHCGFCGGIDTNAEGVHETMVTCVECSRGGHPTCMKLAEIGDVIRSYPWKCLECKSCEICHEKGDDERILFCDCCDRGWHMDCLDPPISETPTGRWHCPMCPPILPEDQMEEYEAESATSPPQTHTPQTRDSSVASSSKSVLPSVKIPKRARNKGKGRAPVEAVSDDGDGEEEEEEEESTPRASRGRPRIRSAKKSRGRPPKEKPQSEEEETYSSSPAKRRRIRVSSPVQRQHLPRVRLRLPAQNKGKDREEEEPPKGMFEDILTTEERDTSKTTITNLDRVCFDRSRRVAEEKSLPPPPPIHVNQTPHPLETPGPSSRPLRSSTLQQLTPLPAATPLQHAGSSSPTTPSPLTTEYTASRIRTIRTIRFGPYDIDTWYDAPFPEEYATIPDGRLWMCEFCLKYMKSHFGTLRHRMKCKARHPPGDEIYRDNGISIFEVDGRKNKIYCQNLCLLSKMFLDHKSLFYDVEPFLFYVVTEVDDLGARFVGYFSKEKRSPKDYNVSCIMTLPVRQRQGWGNLLIDFSYLLSKKEKRLGSPEKPLSQLGALGYKSYWRLAVLRYLATAPERPRLEDICQATSMTMEDVFNTLKQENMITFHEPTPPLIRPSPGQSIKFPKGRRNGMSRRQIQRLQSQEKDPEASKGPFVPPTRYEITWDSDHVSDFLQKWDSRGLLTLKPDRLQWSPYLLTRGDGIDLKQVAALSINGPATSSGVDSDTPSGQPEDPRRQRGETESDHAAASEGHADQDESTEAQESPKKRLRNRARQSSGPVTPLREDQRLLRSSRRDTDKRNKLEEQDRALAQKVATTEQRQTRSLRSGSGESTAHDPRQMSTPSISPRKRKQVVPEEPAAEAMNECSPTRTNGHVNGMKQHQDNASSATDQLQDSDAADILLKLRAPAPPHRLQAAATANGHGDREVVENGTELDVKSEDMGTPLTSLTSRQSPPSEETVFCPETAGKERGGERARVEVETAEGDMDAEGEANKQTSHDELGLCNPTHSAENGSVSRWTDRYKSAFSFIFCIRSIQPCHSDPPMQYGHMPMSDRRDSALDSNGSTPFQTHTGLGQALGTHLPGPPAYSRPTDNFRNLSTSPPGLAQNGPPGQHPGPSTSHSPLAYVGANQGSPAMKRKHVDGVMAPQVSKRRREGEDSGDAYDIDGVGQGAKHWTDDEKTKLFTWLMGPGQDDHWNLLRAAKNSCLRECANDVFGGKKTYQALKGCYERNFNLFKQIYAFEAFHGHSAIASLANLSEADRLREYERRLQGARKGACDVGNITARTIDHWRRQGWYDLFYRRWHGDPATTRPVQTRNPGAGPPNGSGVDDQDDEEPMDFPDPLAISNGLNPIGPDRNHNMNFLPPQNIHNVPQPLPSPVNGLSNAPTTTNAAPPPSSTSNGIGGSSGSTSTATTSIIPPLPPQPNLPPSPSDQPLLNVTITQGMVATYMQFLQVQTQTGKMKMEYLRRKEEREERDSAQKRELEKIKLERETAEFEHKKHSAMVKQNADRAIELLGKQGVEPSLRQAAGDYLKKLFTAE
ncbi:hypothetical protein BDN72DRAFT_815391 [Pluteus cervinus]|uniref:Uncharacterized protein n=1 Tax=Pluteus cervinus TaxID=181527 RepID=A0ACD3B4G0_9AGAR|nr:hypothetical protein BDN72DRAFT_815391 [Pluteus cervinus]